MQKHELNILLKKILEGNSPDTIDLESVLSIEDPELLGELYSFADKIRKQFCGDGIYLRGIVEFSSHCSNKCSYCGLNSDNKKLKRYKLTDKELMDSIDMIHKARVSTVVLQSGEDKDLDPEWLAGIVRKIKNEYGLSITLSVGEKTEKEYALWKDAGADRYLLKIETIDPAIYAGLHPGMSLENRKQCLRILKKLGFQAGSGLIIGLKGQTARSLSLDLLYLKEMDFDMIGLGPFIPHSDTCLNSEPHGDVTMTLKVLALTRILTKNSHLPATTSLGSIEGNDYRADGLKAGANVVMPNFTPAPYRKLYEIYPGKRCVEEKPGLCSGCMEGLASSIGRYIDYSKGDSLKK